MKCSYYTGTVDKLSPDRYERSDIKLWNGVRTSAVQEIRVAELFIVL
jgi:hypothetical protein